MADRQGSGRGEGKDINVAHLANKGRNANEGKRFVFRTFAQRVAAVNIDVHHSLAGDLADAREASATRTGDESSALEEMPIALSKLEHWVDLDCTAALAKFREEISPLLLSLPLMLRKRSDSSSFALALDQRARHVAQTHSRGHRSHRG